MTLWEVILVGIALSMDAFAVSVADGMLISQDKKRYAAIIALAFGIFQAVMPIAGYALVRLCEMRYGSKQAVYGALRAADHWVAFGLLVFLGGKMIAGSLHSLHSPKNDTDGEDGSNAPMPQAASISPRMVFVQAVATSIDALAVGIGLGAIGGGIVHSALVIGATTTVICLPAVYLGRRVRSAAGGKAETAGGAVLIAIGTRILLTHLMGGT